MKNIVIFEDGKTHRGSKAKLIRRGNKRVLVEFANGEGEIIQDWFKLYIPSYASNKKLHRHDNKRNHASYCHAETNQFYSAYKQTDSFKLEFKEYVSSEYYNKLFGGT